MAASCTIAATRAWINDPANPLTVITSGTSGSNGGGGQRLTTVAVPGEVRNYGNGRIRTVIEANVNMQMTLTMRLLTPAQVQQLRAWAAAGTVLCFRDTYGQKILGTIFATQELYTPLLVVNAATPVTGNPFVDVALSISLVTATAGT